MAEEEEFEAEEAVEQDDEELRDKTLDSLNRSASVSTAVKGLYYKARQGSAIRPEKLERLAIKSRTSVRGQLVGKMESMNLHGVSKVGLGRSGSRPRLRCFERPNGKRDQCQRRSGRAAAKPARTRGDGCVGTDTDPPAVKPEDRSLRRRPYNDIKKALSHGR